MIKSFMHRRFLFYPFKGESDFLDAKIKLIHIVQSHSKYQQVGDHLYFLCHQENLAVGVQVTGLEQIESGEIVVDLLPGPIELKPMRPRFNEIFNHVLKTEGQWVQYLFNQQQQCYESFSFAPDRARLAFPCHN